MLSVQDSFLLSPLRRLVLALFFELVALLFRVMNGTIRMLSGCIYGVEDEGSRVGIDEVVPRTSRDNDNVTRVDRLLFAIDDGLASAFREREVLVDMVDLFTDLASGRDAHDHELGVLAGPEDTAEILAALGDRVNVSEVVHALQLRSSSRGSHE